MIRLSEIELARGERQRSPKGLHPGVAEFGRRALKRSEIDLVAPLGRLFAELESKKWPWVSSMRQQGVDAGDLLSKDPHCEVALMCDGVPYPHRLLNVRCPSEGDVIGASSSSRCCGLSSNITPNLKVYGASGKEKVDLLPTI